MIARLIDWIEHGPRHLLALRIATGVLVFLGVALVASVALSVWNQLSGGRCWPYC